MNGQNSDGSDDLLLGGRRFELDLEHPELNPQGGEGGGTATGGEGGTGGAAPGAQGGAGGAAPQVPDNVARMIADTTARATKAEQDAALLRQQMEDLRKSQPQPYMGTQPPNPADVRARLADELQKKFIENPGNALADILLAAREISQQNAQGAITGVANSQADMMIRNFISTKQNDPSWGVVKDSFMQMVEKARQITSPEQLARATASEIQDSLEAFYERAAGRAALTTMQKRTRENSPPLYSTGSGGSASGNLRALQGGASGEIDLGSPKDAVEREIIDSARSYNLPDDQIKAALKAYREEASA